MAQSAKCMPATSSGKKISVEPTAVIRANRKAEQKGSRRRISCRDLGNGEYEGWMWCKKEKVGFGSNSWRKYWFMLKDKSLYCYKDPQDVVARRLYHLPAFLVSVARETSRKHAFKISHASFGTVLFATKDYADMSKWMTHLIFACEEESDTSTRKKSDESTGDVSESDNEEENTEEEKKSLQSVTEKEDETEDKDLTCAAPTAMCLSDSSSSAVSPSETESIPLPSSYQESTSLTSSGAESHLSTSCNSESDPVRSSVTESTCSSSSKEESTPASEQEPSQLLCSQPKSNSVNLASTEPESTQHTSQALEPTVAAKKACGPTPLSKPKPSPKSSRSAESSASPILEISSLTKPTFGPRTFAKPLRTVPSTGTQTSTTDSSPFALARLAFETASAPKPLPSTTVVAPTKLLKISDAADGSANTPSETPSQGNTNTGPGTCAKLSPSNIAIKAPTETSAVPSVASLPCRTSTGPAFSATPSLAVSLARASSATEHSTTQLAASTTNMKNVIPATFAKSLASPRAVSESLPPSWNVSGQACSSKTTASATRSSAISSSTGDNTLLSSEAHCNFVKSQSLQREETRLLAVTSQSGNEKGVLDIPFVQQNSGNLSSQSEHTSEESEDQIADTFQLSASERAHTRMTHIAKSIRLKTKPSPDSRSQELCSHLLMLQRSFKDKVQELQILEELLKTPVMTSDKLTLFRHENRDFAKRLTGNSVDLEGFESDTENRLEDVSIV